MRSIKFKFVDEEIATISKAYTIDELARGLYKEGTDVENMKKIQFTGLLDKQGVEIYEGDIVSHVYGFGNGKAKVAYWGNIYKLESNSGTCDEILFSECEVIGNIYENPELLES